VFFAYEFVEQVKDFRAAALRSLHVGEDRFEDALVVLPIGASCLHGGADGGMYFTVWRFQFRPGGHLGEGLPPQPLVISVTEAAVLVIGLDGRRCFLVVGVLGGDVRPLQVDEGSFEQPRAEAQG
jgi:hypothetical protein